MKQIICGDCTKELKNIKSNSVDLIVADPPYNVGKDYGNDSDKQEFEDYLAFTREWLTECHRILKKNGTMYVFIGFRYISYLYQIMEQDLGMSFINWISWHYTQGVGKTKGFSPRHDDILMFAKSKSYKFNLDSNKSTAKVLSQGKQYAWSQPWRCLGSILYTYVKKVGKIILRKT